MEFKYINDKNKTPQSKSSVFSSTANCEKFINLHSNISTPPSRFSKIMNPFECRLIDKLHLPTFSPSVFTMQSTPKTDEKFKWTIEEISSLKPADIDEGTISQHVFDEDPHVESLVQQKIDEFFSEKMIVPSPMPRVPLITVTPDKFVLPKERTEYSEGSTQTALSLPPVLPSHIEEILKPYFLTTDSEQNQKTDIQSKNVFFQNLFKNCDNTDNSLKDDHNISELSGKDFSPSFKLKGRHSQNFDLPDCSLSPIGDSGSRSSKESRSAVRLDFSSRMSMDASLVVPDIGNEVSNQEILETSHYNPQPLDELSSSSMNWDLEYAHVSLISPTNSPNTNHMDVSNANTPHLKLFSSQRKRLSHSFNVEEDESKKESDTSKQGRKLFRNNITDAGYYTESAIFYDESKNSVHMFASTPTKTRRN